MNPTVLSVESCWLAVARVERLTSGKYRIRWTDPWGRRTSKTFTTAADARAWYRKVLGDMARGDYIDPRRSRTTVAEWADDWLAGARNLSRGGYDTYRRDLDRYILPALGRLPLGKVRSTDIDRYLAEKAGTAASTRTDGPLSSAELGNHPRGSRPRPLAPSTVHRHYRTLHRMFAVAVKRGMLARNPCTDVEPPAIPRTEITVLDAAQVDALAAAITPRYRVWVLTMAYGGLRWSESVGLRRRRVDVPSGGETSRSLTPPERPLIPGAERRLDPGPRGPLGTCRLMIVEQLIHRGKGDWERCEPKSGSRRVVTLPNFVADEMAGHLDHWALPGPDGLVFPTRNGTPLQAPSFTANTFRRALEKAGLPRIRIHDLRHTAISLAIAAGANPKLSQARAGHSSIGIHLDRYGHLFAGADQAVADALDELHAQAQRSRLHAV